jgi:prenyltransferase beta subunit
VRRYAAILALGALLVTASAAAAPNPTNEAALDRTIRYLQEAQQHNGGFAASGEPSQITSAWTALALAAAGINPRDQERPGGVDAFAYLLSHYRQGVEETECAPIACTTVLERELMVVNSAGANPHDFGGVDLVAELLARARPDGSFPHVPGGQPGVNDTIFAVFALAPISERGAQAAIGPAADWIESVQHTNGGWAWSATSTRAEVDMTGAAIQALLAAGRGRNAAVESGIAYLRDAQNPEGGFPEFPGNPESNVASTAWAVQAIWAVGENPEAWRTGSGQPTEEPLDYMESLQQPDGHIRWKQSQDLNGIWMTAYSSVALGGHNWPVPEAPRSSDPAQPPGPGQGEGTQSGDGVIAGGGGKGAPLFSRPKPQSKGKTPGGARVVRNRGAKAKNHSRTRRGVNAKQPTHTQTAEARSAAENARAREAIASGSGPGVVGNNGTTRRLRGEGGGEEVTGTLIGSLASEGGDLSFGAPGLHGAGAKGGEETAAVAIGAAALLFALAGIGWERRQETVL